MSEHNPNEEINNQVEQVPVEQIDEIAEDMPIEGEVAEQIVKQINQEGDGHPPIPEELPLLPLRDTVIFPVLVAPIAVGRENSIKLVDEAVANGDRIIGVVAMKDASVENATAADIYPMALRS
jgi:ATP-dependent Lon protease